MKLLHLSDTHGCHRRLTALPEADIVVHSGDFTLGGSQAEALDFLEWFCELPHPHKIFIAGNHDECLYGGRVEGLDPNVHYLCNSGVEVCGLRFYGVPMFLADCVSERQERNYDAIRAGIDVLVTHTPPYGVLDFDDGIHYGSPELFRRLMEVLPQWHLFGHIHACRGVRTLQGVTCSNGAILGAGYDRIMAPNLFEW